MGEYYTFGEVRNYEFNADCNAPYNRRAAGLREFQKWLSGVSFDGWGGPAAEAAQVRVAEELKFLDKAITTAESTGASGTALSVLLEFQSKMDLANAEAQEAIARGSKMQFRISDTGQITDYFDTAGLVGTLSAQDRAEYEKLKTWLPEQVTNVIATANIADDEVLKTVQQYQLYGWPAPLPATAVTSPAAGAPVAAPAVQDVGNGVVVTTDAKQGMVFVNTGDGDSTISVVQNPDGSLTITTNGVAKKFTKAQARDIEIDSGKGNDKITVSPDVTVRLRLVDAGGDNTIDEEGLGGAYVQTGDGNNKVTLGGGHNYVYLGSGTNTLTGSNGADYVNGGSGNNTINAGKGSSVLYGGTGTNTINAGSGTDKVYTGSGKVTVNNQGGDDTIYAQDGATINQGSGHNTVVHVNTMNIPDSVTVSGTPEFRERVLADLQMIASSPTGQHMLDGIGHSGHTLDISNGATWNDPDPGHEVRNNSFTSITDQNGDAVRDDPGTEFVDPKTGHHGAGGNSIIGFDPTLTDLGDPSQGAKPDYHDLPPEVVLYHEMAHAYDFTNGTMMPGDYGPNGTDQIDDQLTTQGYLANAEHEAVGLPVDWDGNPRTPETFIPDDVHPHIDTENALREELGIPDREHYLG